MDTVVARQPAESDWVGKSIMLSQDTCWVLYRSGSSFLVAWAGQLAPAFEKYDSIVVLQA